MRAVAFAAALLATSAGAALPNKGGDGAFATSPTTIKNMLAAHRAAHGRTG